METRSINKSQTLSIRVCDQLFDIREQIHAVTGKVCGASLDRVLISTIVLEISRIMIRHFGVFTYNNSIMNYGNKQALMIRLQLQPSDITALQKKRPGLPELFECDLKKLDTVLKSVDAILSLENEYTLSITKYHPKHPD